MKRLAPLVLCLWAWGTFAGCAAAEHAAATEAEAAFRDQNRACKRQYPDVAAQDACRAKVAESWGVTYTPRHDAGSDAQ